MAEKCNKCDDLAVIGFEIYPNYPIDEVKWCDCELGQQEKARAIVSEAKRKPKLVNTIVPLIYQGETLESLKTLAAAYPNKAKAIAAATTLASDGAIGKKDSLILVGPNGTGKTTIASAVINHQLRKNEGAVWIAAWEMFDKIQAGYSRGNSYDIIKEFIEIPWLLIDDLGDVDAIRAKETDNKRDILFKIFDSRLVWRRPVIMTTNLMPSELAGFFGTRIAERLRYVSDVQIVDGQNLREVRNAPPK